VQEKCLKCLRQLAEFAQNELDDGEQKLDTQHRHEQQDGLGDQVGLPMR
jgi:hypothetical protein